MEAFCAFSYLCFRQWHWPWEFPCIVAHNTVCLGNLFSWESLPLVKQICVPTWGLYSFHSCLLHFSHAPFCPSLLFPWNPTSLSYGLLSRFFCLYQYSDPLNILLQLLDTPLLYTRHVLVLLEVVSVLVSPVFKISHHIGHEKGWNVCCMHVWLAVHKCMLWTPFVCVFLHVSCWNWNVV